MSKANVFGLEGKTCVVTGAGSGIGRAIAQVLAGEGGKVAILDRNLEGANETLELVRAAGGEGIALEVDISDEAVVRDAAAQVAGKLGTPGVLVNNAAMMQSGGLTDMPLAEWNKVISVNLTGFLICSQIFGKPMLAAGEGSVIHTSSIGAKHVMPGLGGYSVTKAAIIAMSNLLAAEWGPQGVRSNVILPGLIQTPFSQRAYDDPKKVEIRKGVIPLRRIGQPEDLASVVLFLASPLSSYVTGSEIMVDGGFQHYLTSLIPRF